LTAPLYEGIGRLKVEGDWLKKKALNIAAEVRRQWIDPSQAELSVSRQCQMAGLARSSCYYRPASAESEENQQLMRRIDKLYLKRPFFGSPKMTLGL